MILHLLRHEPLGNDMKANMLRLRKPRSILVSFFPFALGDWDCGGLTTAMNLTQIRRLPLAQETTRHNESTADMKRFCGKYRRRPKCSSSQMFSSATK